MSRHLFTADLHLGTHGPLDESISFEVLEWIYETADEFKVDTLNIAGDIFKSANPRDSVKSFLINYLINRRGKDIKTRYLVGNHDYALKSGYDYAQSEKPASSADILSGIKQAIGDEFEVISSPRIIPTDQNYFFYYPFGNNYDALNRRMVSDASHHDLKSDMIVIGHFPIVQTQFDNNMAAKTGMDINLLDSPRVRGYFGHFHNHQRFHHSMYCGSPYPQKRNEVGEKGIWIVDIQNGKVVDEIFVENEFSPLFIEININLIKQSVMVYNSPLLDTPRIENLHDLIKISEGNVINLMITGDNTEDYENLKEGNEDLFNLIKSKSYGFNESFEIVNRNKADITFADNTLESFSFDKGFFDFLDGETIDKNLIESISSRAKEILSEIG